MNISPVPLHRNSGGYTLVELLVAIIVGAILVGSISLINVSHTNLSQKSRDLVIVNSYAEQKFEALRSAGFLGIATGATSVTNELPDELKAPRSGSLQITNQNPAIKRAVLTVTYNDQGAQRSYTYSTYIGELGVGQY